MKKLTIVLLALLLINVTTSCKKDNENKPKTSSSLKLSDIQGFWKNYLGKGHYKFTNDQYEYKSSIEYYQKGTVSINDNSDMTFSITHEKYPLGGEKDTSYTRVSHKCFIRNDTLYESVPNTIYIQFMGVR